jgi:hypothetical protein
VQQVDTKLLDCESTPSSRVATCEMLLQMASKEASCCAAPDMGAIFTMRPWSTEI